MLSTLKRKQHCLKTIRRFDEDIWGIFSYTKKSGNVFNYLYDLYQTSYKYKKLLRLQKKKHFLKRKNLQFLYKVETGEREIRRRKKTLKIKKYLSMLKLRRFYGGIAQRRIKRIFWKESLPVSFLHDSFAFIMESRLDILLYRTNFFHSIFTIKQYIFHNKIFINGIPLSKPALRVPFYSFVNLQFLSFWYPRIYIYWKIKKILGNYPSYLEINYKLGLFVFWKVPKAKEVPFPCFMNFNSVSQSFLK